jgi:hypothetical protein
MYAVFLRPIEKAGAAIATTKPALHIFSASRRVDFRIVKSELRLLWKRTHPIARRSLPAPSLL